MKLSPEQRAVRAERMSALWADPAFREKMRQKTKRQWDDPDYREKLAAGYDAARGRQTAALQALKQDPEYIRRQREGAQRWQGEHERYCGQCGRLFTGGRFALVCPTCRPRNRAWQKRMMLHLLARDGTACQLCGEPIDFTFGYSPNGRRAPSIDHRVPFSRGGQAVPDNFRLAHRQCNSERGNRD